MSLIKYVNNHIEGIKTSLKYIPENSINVFCEILIKNKSNIFFTGVGKNGHVAAKAVSTFNSMGIKVLYINPIDAVHGDMGMIERDDTVLAISKSGNTEELISFLYNVKKRTNNIWLLHSNDGCKALNYCSNHIFIPVEKEADHLGVIPNVSIAVYTILLQSMACTIAEKSGLSVEEFKKNHPGGSLGKI
jgi:D-arabinose 5-phosphate isomerase GutQ